MRQLLAAPMGARAAARALGGPPLSRCWRWAAGGAEGRQADGGTGVTDVCICEARRLLPRILLCAQCERSFCDL